MKKETMIKKLAEHFSTANLKTAVQNLIATPRYPFDKLRPDVISIHLI